MVKLKKKNKENVIKYGQLRNTSNRNIIPVSTITIDDKNAKIIPVISQDIQKGEFPNPIISKL